MVPEAWEGYVVLVRWTDAKVALQAMDAPNQLADVAGSIGQAASFSSGSTEQVM